MGIINSTEIKNGMTIKFNNELYEVLEYDHVTPGNWRAMIQVKMRNIKPGSTLENRFRANDRVEQMVIETRPAEYMYEKGPQMVFMSTETYEEISITKEVLGEKVKYLIPNLPVSLIYIEGSLVNVQLPMSVDLKIVETSPIMKTATITNVSKPAIMETGFVVQVPAFIQQGEVIKVDTRDGQYVERAKQQ